MKYRLLIVFTSLLLVGLGVLGGQATLLPKAQALGVTETISPPTMTSTPTPTSTPRPTWTATPTVTPSPTITPTPTPDMSELDRRLQTDADLRAAICQPDTKITPRQGDVIVPIFLYHFVGRATLEDESHHSKTRYDVTKADFDAQLALLRRLGYHTVTIDQVVAAIHGQTTLPSRPIALTIDDGWIEQYTNILPLLQKYGMVATYYIPSTYPVGGRFVTWDQLQEIANAGMEIGAHTRKHVDLTSVDAQTAWYELSDSKATLEAHLGITITSLSYPYANYSPAVIAMVKKAGYTSAVAMGSTPRQNEASIYRLNRTEIFGTHTLADFVERLPWRGQGTVLCPAPTSTPTS